MSYKFFNECVSKSIERLFSANIYKGTSPKKKTDLIEKIIYGCITEKLDKKNRRYINKTSNKTRDINKNQILNKSNITVKSLPDYGNVRLKKKEIKAIVREKLFIKILYYLFCLLQVLLNKKITPP